MAVKRIVHNIAASDVEAAKAFYQDILDMEPVMNLGWIATYASTGQAAPQVSIASEGGSGTAVPDLSIEIDNFEDVVSQLQASGITIEYGPVDEPWGVRRLYARDPFGKLVNILKHR